MSYCRSVGSSGNPPPLDLSHAIKLKDVGFHFDNLSVKWIVATLQTAKSKYLRQITIFSSTSFDTVEGEVRREWQDLDHLLVRLWTSRLIIPKIKYISAPEREDVDLGEVAPSLLPELVSRGVVCEVGDYLELSRSSI